MGMSESGNVAPFKKKRLMGEYKGLPGRSKIPTDSVRKEVMMAGMRVAGFSMEFWNFRRRSSICFFSLKEESEMISNRR